MARVKHRLLVTLITATALFGTTLPARADNPMGYKMLTERQARQMPRAGGVLGIQVERSAEIQDSGLKFQVVRVTVVHPGSPGAQAGIQAGDQIIAVNGQVFEDADAFAGLIGSMQPGSRAVIDYIPQGGGPAQAQRVTATLGGRGGSPQYGQEQQQRPGLTTGEKVAIGVGAAALLGCYELGCFNHRTPQPTYQPGVPQQQQQR